MSTTEADLVTTPCTGLEYLTRSEGWSRVEAAVPLGAITRPAQHSWGPWSKTPGRARIRERSCRVCAIRIETQPTEIA